MSQNSLVGKSIGNRYRIDDILGQGGMSAVYKAYDPNLKRVVAVKMIHPHLASDPKFIVRFEEEAAAVAQLRHPNIVQVFDFNHDEDRYYMVQEFVPGETLQDLLRRLSRSGKRMPVAEAIRYTLDICDAAGYAHQRGMIHRDIKPANIMLNVQGSAILMDFGIVKITGGQNHTATGAVVGTALYMPPELIRGEVPDSRADQYSLGVTLFEMVSGRPPFEADSAMSLMMMHLRDPLPDLRQLRPDVPEELITVIAKTLAKEKTERYASLNDLAGALRKTLDHLPLDIPVKATLVEDAALTPGTETLPETGSVLKEALAISKAITPTTEDHQPVVTEPTPATFTDSPVSEDYQAGRTLKEKTFQEVPVDEVEKTIQDATDRLGDETISVPPAAGFDAESKSALPGPEIQGDLSPGAGTHSSENVIISATSAENRPGFDSPSPAPKALARKGVKPAIWIGAGILLLIVVLSGITIVLTSRGNGENKDNALASDAGTAPALVAAGMQIDELIPTATASPTPTPSTTSTPTQTFTPTISPTATLSPTPTIPPGIHFVRINSILTDLNGNYVVDYETFEYTEKLPGMHVHFFFNTVPPEQAGNPGTGPWKLYGGPRPFTEYRQNQRPENATQMCALVANHDHSVQAGSGTCYDLPDVVLTTPLADTACLTGPDLAFPVFTPLFAGQRLRVLGISPDENWWYVANPQNPDETCWVAQVETTVSGDISTLGLIEPPPLPEGASANDLSVEITRITIDDQARYVTEYITRGFTEALPGLHMHFFFNTVSPDQVGMSGGGDRLMYGGPSPFTGYKTADRPAAATQLCVLVANPNHSVIPDSGNCMQLPDVAAP